MGKRTTPKRTIIRWVAGLALGLLLTVGTVCFWIFTPLSLKSDLVDLSIEPGTSVRGVAQTIVASGVDTTPHALWLWFRLSGQSRTLRAGSYEITTGTSPWKLLQKLVVN